MSARAARHLETGGGCLCGALRYAVQGTVVDAGYCHCRMCQRASGAPVVAWYTVPFEAFRYSAGEARIYRSSALYQRESCACCGTPIAFRRQQSPQLIDLTLTSLDEPALITPDYHIWRMSRLPWFDTADRLPRHDDAGPDQA